MKTMLAQIGMWARARCRTEKPSATLKEFPQQKCLQACGISWPRRQSDNPAKPVRIPVEIALIILADQGNHAVDDGLFDVAVEAGIDRDGLATATARIGSPAAEDVLRHARALADDFEHAIGTATGAAFLEGNIGARDIVGRWPGFRRTRCRILGSSRLLRLLPTCTRSVEHGRHIHFRRRLGNCRWRWWQTWAWSYRAWTWPGSGDLLTRCRCWFLDWFGFGLRWLSGRRYRALYKAHLQRWVLLTRRRRDVFQTVTQRDEQHHMDQHRQNDADDGPGAFASAEFDRGKCRKNRHTMRQQRIASNF